MILLLFLPIHSQGQDLPYTIVHTGISEYYSDIEVISPPAEGQEFFGQDADYPVSLPSYTDNGDSTITDNLTGLTWQKYMGEKMSYAEARSYVSGMELGGYDDWRIPEIKELYSLILFTGQVKGQSAMEAFIDEDYFDQPLGDVSQGEREIDAQTWSATRYVSTTMNSDTTIFGVNFVDGRIKGYPKYKPRTGEANKMYFRMVRGNPDFGQNKFVDNGDGTVSDLSTGLMWQKADDGISRDWKEALQYAEDLELAGYTDWRLPNAKQLQSLVDYSRAPEITDSPAIDPVFETTEILDPDGVGGQYPYFWTGTTHLDGVNPYSKAVYIAFGEAQGRMGDVLMDVHGAGSQRSDPKSGNPEDFPDYFGPQGDVRYVYNYVRCVRIAEPATLSISEENPWLDEPGQYSIHYRPLEGSLVVDSNVASFAVVNLFDLSGRLLASGSFRGGLELRMDMNHLEPSMYLVLVSENGKGMLTEKIFRQ